MNNRTLSTLALLVAAAVVAIVAGCSDLLGLGGYYNECGQPVDAPNTCPDGGTSSSSGAGGGAGPTCQDHEHNGDETDVDCGGSCPACGDGKGCATGADCQSHACSAAHTCVSAGCTDGAQNGAETDVDCGGATCTACVNEKRCDKARDCQSGSCVAGRCKPWATSLSATEHHTCAIRANGDVWCWGKAQDGELGDGVIDFDKTEPIKALGLPGPMAAVSAGVKYSCGLSKAGAVYCWGDNTYGQLGNGTTDASLTPVLVSGLSSGVAAIDAGSLHACAITTAGATLCWGTNFSGELGDGTTTDSAVPVMVSPPLTAAQSVSAGNDFSCAVTANGFPLCWGFNGQGQIGDGTTTTREVPTSVTMLGAVRAIAAGTCALTVDGGVYCWGSNNHGQIGDGETTSPRLTPASVSGLSSGVGSIMSAEGHNCAVMTDGSMRCWGTNGNGELGDGSTTDASKPVVVTGLPPAAAVTGGFNHTCALTKQGAVYCWGDNDYGELGDGTMTEHHQPVLVVEKP